MIQAITAGSIGNPRCDAPPTIRSWAETGLEEGTILGGLMHSRHRVANHGACFFPFALRMSQ
jgi:hypothetical protein